MTSLSLLINDPGRTNHRHRSKALRAKTRRRADKNQIPHFRNGFLQAYHHAHALLPDAHVRVQQLDQALLGFQSIPLAQLLGVRLARDQIGIAYDKDRLSLNSLFQRTFPAKLIE